ncbi:MAG: SHOCT domain-containing protein [Verrucomicrobiae bacterium]|nr:SHOCT domain-containing protein [Verrucomicrobiae bacterium]
MAENAKPDQPIAELTQKVAPFARQEAVLFADRVELRYSGFLRQWRHRVHLHGTKEKLDSMRNPISAGLVARFVFMLIGSLVFSPALPFLIYFTYKFLQGRRRMYVLAYGSKIARGGQQLNFPMFFLPADKPTPQAVEKFLAAFTEAHKAHMRKLQTAQSETHYITEIKQFNELKQDGVLTEEEFAAIKAELLGMREKKIGF